MGKFTKDGFMMLKGSRIEPVISKSCPNNVVEQKQNYTEHISDNILTSNILLTSPSAAEAFASGSSRNGNISWKTAEGITLGRFEEWLSLEKTHEHIYGNNKTK